MATTPEQDLRGLALQNLDAQSLCHAFQATAAAIPEAPAVRTPDGELAFTYGEWASRVEAIAGALAALGVADGECVGLMLTNRPEYFLVDVACMHLGATPFSIYNTNPAEKILPLLRNSDARVAITEQAFLPRLVEAQKHHPALETIVVVDGDAPEGGLTLADLEAREAPAGFDFDARWQAVGRDHVLTLVYTSGTTGDPKGVQHTHGTILANLRTFDDFCPVTPQGRLVSFLPAAHIAERYISQYGSMVNGHCITAVADPTQLPAALAVTKPTRMFAVPRVWEKLRSAVLGMAAAEPEGPLAKAIEDGMRRVQAQTFGQPLEAPAPEHEAVLAAVRGKLGLDQLECAIVAAAPSPRAMLEFYPAIGVNLIEFWGMSECTFSTANPPDRALNKIGTIGKAAPGVECKLGDDGEILVRGPHIMVGYRKEPEKTAEAIDADGWLHTGDVGEMDEDGYITIVDRKKELIINAAGKNMAPSMIEMSIKDQDPLIAQVVAIGDGRQFVTALIVLDEEALGREGRTAEEAAADPAVQERVAKAVEAGNQKLARVEQVKYHTILPVAWAPGGDELTPTMKLKRKPINEKYASEIEALYERDG
jgi:long-chain acyl-CoA synthetase